MEQKDAINLQLADCVACPHLSDQLCIHREWYLHRLEIIVEGIR
jgi:hypothetical protein